MRGGGNSELRNTETAVTQGKSHVHHGNQWWETSGARSDLTMALQTTKLLLHFHFTEIKLIQMRFSRNSKLRQETWIGSVQFVPSLLKVSMNETKLDL